MASPPRSRPGRSLLALAVIVVVLFGSIAATVWRGDPKGQWTPKLGLDLEGGTSITLQPRPTDAAAGKVTKENIDQAVGIIRQRVDSFGVAEAEVTAQGQGAGQNIVISIPGKQSGDVLQLVRQTAELRFRQVLAADVGSPPAPAPSGSPAPSPSASSSPSAGSARPSSTVRPGSAAPSASASASTNGRAVPEALAAAESPKPSSAPSSAKPTPTTAAPKASASTPAQPDPANPGEAIPADLQAKFAALDCSTPEARRGGGGDDPAKPTVACDRDGSVKYVLGKAELLGTDVSGADASLATNSQGQVTAGQWQVNLSFTGDGTKKFAATTTRVTTLQPPENQLAIVLDGLVVSAPTINEPITGGQAQITGNFDQKSASDLANVLRYGALPLAFDPGEVLEISPTLGSDQLRAGLLAGAIGMALVVLYSLLYYRGLGLVSVASLAVAALLTYGALVLLGNQIGLRLSLAGVAGTIVAIGITADSFIVYFERLRDEVRDGRTLRVAVESGWRRSRRTTLAADFVSFLAAVVLYLLSVGSVKGFAFTLGLTTVIDVLVVFLFTKPLVTLLAHTRFFGSGHPLSGLDPARLGARGRSLTAPLGRRRPAAGTATATRTGSGATATPKEA